MPIFGKKGHSVRNKKPHMNNVSTMPVFRKKIYSVYDCVL
jgi:hypothetical protein